MKKTEREFPREYEECEAWQKFLNQMRAKELEQTTQEHYRQRLENYFAEKQMNPDDLIRKFQEADNIISVMKHWVADFRNFYGNITGRSFRTHLSGWKEFVRANEVNVDWKAIPTPRGKGVRARFAPSKTELVKLLDVCGIREKTAVLIMCSSGVRIGGLINLRLSDVNFESGLMKITPKTSKSQVKYRAVMSAEALDVLKEYLEVRGFRKSQWIFEGAKGNHIDRTQMWRILNQSMKRADLVTMEGSNHNGSYRLTPHSFRRFFKGASVEARADRDFVETLMGHGGLTVGSIYLTAPDDQIIRMYREQIEPNVTIRDFKELKLRFEGVDLPPEAWNRIGKIIQEQTEDAIKNYIEEFHAKQTEDFRKRIKQAQN